LEKSAGITGRMPKNEDVTDKKTAAIDAVLEATALLAKEKFPTVPTTRDVAKRSGYGIGTIYRYFPSIGGVINKVVIKRQTEAMRAIANVVDRHSPNEKLDSLVDQVVQMCFASFQSFNPDLVRFVFNLALKHEEKPEALNRVVDHIVPIFCAVQSRDQTGSFKKLSQKETIYAMRTAVFLIRTPLLEGSDFFGTLEHKRLVKTHFMALFSTNGEWQTQDILG
jgi:AcrR family transcriptional regulator